MNSITEIVRGNGRAYLKPEDVSDALRLLSVEKMRCDLLEVLGKLTDFSAENVSLCAYIACRRTASSD